MEMISLNKREFVQMEWEKNNNNKKEKSGVNIFAGENENAYTEYIHDFTERRQIKWEKSMQETGACSWLDFT